MSSPTAFDSIEARLRQGWAETPLVFENEDFELPDTPAAFVYVEVVGDSYWQDTIGIPQANEWQEEGAIYLHVMAPAGTGSAQSRQIGDRLMYLFREQQAGDLNFREMSIGAGEPGKQFGNYYAMTVTIAWDRRDITSIP